MKLSELRACDGCRGPLGFSFNVVRHSGALVGGKPTREVLGLTAMLGGSLRVAEALSPATEDAVMVFGDEDERLETELLLCHECFGGRLADLVEARAGVSALDGLPRV